MKIFWKKKTATFDSAEQTEGKLVEILQLDFAAIFEKLPIQKTATNVPGLESGLQSKRLHLKNLFTLTLPVRSDEVNLLQGSGREDGMVDVAEAVDFLSKAILVGLRGDEDEASVLHLSILR